MKNNLFLTLLLLLGLLGACQNKQPDASQNDTPQTEETLPRSAHKAIPNELGYRDAKILKKAYVTAPSGLLYREKPNGKVIDKFPYARLLEIIEYSGEEMVLEDEGKIISGEWVAVKKGDDKVYVFDGFLGSVSKINLQKETLCTVQGFFSSKVKKTFYESGEEQCVDDILKFEIITEKEFKNYKKEEYYINADSSNAHRIGDTLFVNGHKFIDKIKDGDIYISHLYAGKIDFLNKYILARALWENADYILVDAATGKIDKANAKLIEKAMNTGENWLGFPRISPDKKHLLTLESAIYNKSAELILFSIKKDRSLVLELSLLFKTWSPIDEEVYWISDTAFITKAVHTNVLDAYDYGEPIGNPNFLKITLR